MLSPKKITSTWRSLARRPHVRKLSTANTQATQDAPGGVDYEDFFRCSTKRWLYNEEKQLALRYVKFDVTALQRVAAKAAGASHCVSMVKTAEGSFNKIFTLRFDTGTEAIARIPCPISGPVHLAVASEVATLDFVRTRMQIPVPRVLAWSSGKEEENAVGAEYIIMEKLTGVPLSDRWLEVERKDVLELIHTTIAYEKRFSEVVFSQIGSLYFKEDVSPALQARRLYAEGVPDDEASEKYRIGPTLQREFWRDGRMDMDIDRGPWPDAKAYAIAIVNRERRWLETRAKPCTRSDPFQVFDEGGPEAHIAMLDRFLSVVPHIIRGPDIFQPTLWHTDLHQSNVIVQPDGKPEVLGVIDWQEWIGPKFLRAGFAQLFLYDGHFIDLDTPAPKLPDGYEELTEDRQAEARLQLELASRHKVYAYFMRQDDPAHAQILADSRYTVLFALFRHAARSWSDGLVLLREALVELAAGWEMYTAPGVPCPLRFKDEALEIHVERFSKVRRYEGYKLVVEHVLGLGPDGLVPDPQRYDLVRADAERMREVWEADKPEFPWPLQDGGWSSLF